MVMIILYNNIQVTPPVVVEKYVTVSVTFYE